MKGPTYKCILIKGTGKYINNNTHTQNNIIVSKIKKYLCSKHYDLISSEEHKKEILAYWQKKTKSQTFYLTFPFVFHRRKKVI